MLDHIDAQLDGDQEWLKELYSRQYSQLVKTWASGISAATAAPTRSKEDSSGSGLKEPPTF